MSVSNILFRGKTNSVEWVYGYFVELVDYIDESKKRTMIIPVGSTIYPRCEIASPIEVIADTVSQWTGLVDKNGVKIFGGDIVSYKYTSRFFDDTNLIEHCANHPEITHELTATVVYKDGEFTPIPKIYSCYDYWYSYAYCDFEVIGNIWDNPELVKSVSER